MALHLFVFLLVVCLLLALALFWCLDRLPHRPSSPKGAAKRSSLPRLLKPRTPDDCPDCRLGSPAALGGGTVSALVRPWSEVKSRRGAPKRISTEGFACPNRQCTYFGNTDAHRHALVGDGKHGRAEQIQTFRCQACHTTFTCPSQHALIPSKNPFPCRVAMVLSALAEGLDPSAAERVAGLPSGHHHEVAHARRRTRTHAARALLLPPPPPAPAVRRVAHPTPLRQRGALALAGHRSHDEAASRPASGSPHAKRRASRHPRSATHPGTWLHPTFHE